MPKSLLRRLVRPLITQLVKRAPALAPSEGVGAAAYASSPAPGGYHWEFVTAGGELVTQGGIPVIDLVRN